MHKMLNLLKGSFVCRQRTVIYFISIPHSEDGQEPFFKIVLSNPRIKS